MEVVEDQVGTNYALHIALQTMKERCQQFQNRVTTLEAENIVLRSKSNQLNQCQEESLNEIDRLRIKVAELTEQKANLRKNITMVAAENRRLWTRLSNLSQVNENLGNQLAKINNSLVQHNTDAHSPLVRSRTFTQTDPNSKLLQKMQLIDDNDKLSLNLKDISVQLMTSIAKEKSELEIEKPDMDQVSTVDHVMNFFDFLFSDEEEKEGSIVESFEQHLQDLKYMKKGLLEQKKMLTVHLTNLQSVKEMPCRRCKHKMVHVSASTDTTLPISIENNEDFDEINQLDSLATWGNCNTIMNSTKAKSLPMETSVYICPMCNLKFRKENGFESFQIHVENHFLLDLP